MKSDVACASIWADSDIWDGRANSPASVATSAIEKGRGEVQGTSLDCGW